MVLLIESSGFCAAYLEKNNSAYKSDQRMGYFCFFVLVGSMHHHLESKRHDHIICKLYALFERIES